MHNENSGVQSSSSNAQSGHTNRQNKYAAGDASSVGGSVNLDTEHDEGHSIAAWVGVCIMLFGFSAGTVAYWFASWLWVFIGLGIILLGIVLWVILRLFGLGPKIIEGRHVHGRI